MLKRKLDELLLLWTEHEYVCKEYIEASKDPVYFKEYIKAFDKSKCYELRLSLPYITDDMPRPAIIHDFFDDDVFIVRHGRYDIPFRHRHTFFEVLFVYQGTAVNTIGGVDHVLHEKELMFIPPNVEHELFTTGVVVDILFKKSFISSNFFNFVPFYNSFSSFFFDSVYAKEQHKFLVIDISDNANVTSLIYNLIEEGLSKREKGNILMNSLVQSILFLLCRDQGQSAQLSEDMSTTNQLVVDIVHYISENYCNVTLEDVARKFNYSVPYLSKVISNTMNMTFKEIVYKTRIDKALNLLSSAYDSVESISEVLGYGNPASFYRAFKNVIGMTPNEYRENCRKTQYIFNN